MNSSAYNAAYYQRTKAEQAAKQRVRLAAIDPAELARRRRATHERLKEQRNAYMRKWRAANKRRLLELSRAWREANRERHNESKHAYRARRAGAGGRYTEADIERIWSEQGGKCPGCLDPLGARFHRDHVVALAAGGTNEANNIQLLCRSCNCAKRDRPLTALLAQRGI